MMSFINSILEWPPLAEFLAQPLFVQFIFAFTFLFFFFIFIMWVKVTAERWRKRGGMWKFAAGVMVMVFGPAFLLADVGVNVIYAPMIYGQRANKFDEGWLLTSRLQWHKAQPGMYWQKKVSLFICDRMVEKIDPGHCDTTRFS